MLLFVNLMALQSARVGLMLAEIPRSGVRGRVLERMSMIRSLVNWRRLESDCRLTDSIERSCLTAVPTTVISGGAPIANYP